ncbi:MAG: type II toxin-antitoxin system death-on-curing family toxin [Candidatus Nomurabacteria bacterium]|jgi:death-on-curing family protein|nr:type II toxin-antitoxin system death-on-curing family toxin [Candidatus Nomurabacteria bacterium]
MRQLDIGTALSVIFEMPEFLKTLGFNNEPMWSISDANVSELEACLERPFQTFNGTELYPSAANKAAVLFYQIAKGHKLENGNKRTAVVLTLMFLFVNNLWLDMSSDAMYDLALSTANSKAKDKEVVMSKIEKVFGDHIKKISLLDKLFRQI